LADSTFALLAGVRRRHCGRPPFARVKRTTLLDGRSSSPYECRLFAISFLQRPANLSRCQRTVSVTIPVRRRHEQ
jgi:hypothetical protein